MTKDKTECEMTWQLKYITGFCMVLLGVALVSGVFIASMYLFGTDGITTLETYEGCVIDLQYVNNPDRTLVIYENWEAKGVMEIKGFTTIPEIGSKIIMYKNETVRSCWGLSKSKKITYSFAYIGDKKDE